MHITGDGIFGCTASNHVDEEKLNVKAKKDIFLGNVTGVQGYRLWSVDDSKFVLSSVTFDEDIMVVSQKAKVTCVNDIQTSNTQVIEIESKDRPGSIHVQHEAHGDTCDEDNDQFKYNTIIQ